MDQDQQAVSNSEDDDDDSTLRWADVEKIAKNLFKVWRDGSELKWAEIAWGHIVAAGYAEGEFGKEHCRARLRFLALATLYADWCWLAADEQYDPEVHYYAEALGLNPFYWGLLLGTDYELDGQDHYGFYEDEIALKNAVRELVNREQPIVAEALIAGFGSPGELFVSLWRTRYPAIEEDDEQKIPDTTKAAISDEAATGSGQQLQFFTEDSDAEDDEEEKYDNDEYDAATLSDEEILNDVTADKLAAWEWINEECPPLD